MYRKSIAMDVSKNEEVRDIANLTINDLSSVRKEGMLTKLSGGKHAMMKNWRKRWCVCTNEGVYYFHEATEKCKGFIPFAQYRNASLAGDDHKKPNCFKLFAKNSPSLRQYVFVAESDVEMKSWMDILNKVLGDRDVLMNSFRRVTHTFRNTFLTTADDSARRIFRSLYVNVAEARDVRTEKHSGVPLNVYAVVDIASYQFRTRTKKKTIEPFWGEDFSVDLDPSVALPNIRVALWNEDKRIGRTLLGQVTIPISSLGAESSQQWHPVMPPGQEDSVYIAGDVHLKIVSRPQQKLLAVRVLDARNLPQRNKDGSGADPYLEIAFQGTVKKTKVIKQNLNPVWNEEFLFHYHDAPESFTVKCYDWDLLREHDYMGQFEVHLKDIKPEVPNDLRFILAPPSSAGPDPASASGEGGKSPSQSNSNSRGNLRLTLKYTEDVILPAGSYNNMFRFLSLPEGIEMVKAMSGVISSSEDRVDLADAFVHAYEAGAGAEQLFEGLMDLEISSTEDPRVIFRGNSLGTKGLDLYMKLVGSTYLSYVLGPFVSQVYAQKKSCEVDPTQLEPGEEAEKNVARLMQLVQQVIDTIFKSADMCPSSLRAIFKHIQMLINKKWPEDDKAKYSAVSGFIFLRFFCAAILSPKLFDLAPDHPDAAVSRTLKLVAKTVQNLANLVVFEAKEPHLKVMNTLLESNMDRMKTFLDTISSPKQSKQSYSLTPETHKRAQLGGAASGGFEGLIGSTPMLPFTQIPDRELACIHRHLIKNKDKLTSTFPPKIFPWCVHTLAMLDDLEMSNLIIALNTKSSHALDVSSLPVRESSIITLPKSQYQLNLTTASYDRT
eukprot:TRINITY_DN3006_c0_g1_i6.p1 TRINITY_DN3006_c0_g1~~TRINITY_DN3006_c0_g1_i6.p1  ORF type:complete len:885 (+),score=212.06 TRINITY_DN3006_c0_g1_i6:157-2655(+)